MTPHRVREGGHNVPEEDVRRRFAAGIENFLTLYRPLADAWWLYDASRLPPRAIAVEREGEVAVMDARLFAEIAKRGKGANQ